MKNLKTLILLSLTLGLISCSSSDDAGGTNPTITGDYFPSVQANLWTYNVVNVSDDPTGNFTGTDLLTVASASGNSFNLEVNNGTSPANGTFNALLVNGTLTKTDSDLTFTGTFMMPPGFENFFDQQIALNNVVLYDLNANNNEVLSTVSDVINQDLVVGEDTLPLTINYELKTTYTGYSASEIVDGETYTNVVKTRLTLNLHVSTEIIAPVDVLAPQNVLVIDTYYAENIGLIKAEAVSSYELNSVVTGLIDLGIPESSTATNIQELDSYFLN